MSYIPPFTITADILNLVANISEQVGQLNAPLNAPANASLKSTPANIAGLKTLDAILLLLQDNPQLKRLGSDKTGYWQVQPQKVQP